MVHMRSHRIFIVIGTNAFLEHVISVKFAGISGSRVKLSAREEDLVRNMVPSQEEGNCAILIHETLLTFYSIVIERPRITCYHGYVDGGWG